MAVPLLVDIVADPEFQQTVGLSIALNVCIYYSVVVNYPAQFTRSRSKAWILTLVSSLVLLSSCLGMFAEFVSLPAGQTLKDIASVDSSHARQIARYFIGYLIADTIIGVMHYLDVFGFVSGWVHHIGYIIVMLNMLKYRIPGAFFAFAAVMEVSTVFLALGHIYPPWRQDLLFGLSFFLTRVVLHGYLVHHTYCSWSSHFWMAPGLAWALHIYWFITWARSHLFKSVKRD